MKKSQLRINILGTSFSIQSSEDKEYLEKIYNYYKSKINGLQKQAPGVDPLKLAIMAGLTLGEELFKARANSSPPETKDALQKITQRMIHKIDSTLSDPD